MMSRIGLQVRDAFALSFTKLKIRRIRTALTLISTSIMALVLVVASSVLTGFMRAADASPQSALRDLHLAFVYPNGDSFFPGAESGSAPPSTDGATEIQTTRNSVRDKSQLRDVYVAISSGYEKEATIAAIGKPPAPNPNDPNAFFGPPRRMLAMSTPLIEPYVAEGQSLNWSPGQPLPVLIPASAVYDANRKELERIKDPGQRAAKRAEYERAAIGKVTKLELAESQQPVFFGPNGPVEEEPTAPAPPQVFDVKIVGAIPSATFLGPAITDFVVPLEAARQIPAVTATLTQVDGTYPSFTSVKERNRFVGYNETASIYADTVEENKRFFSPIQKAFGIAVIVFLVLMAIPMAATLSKLLSDSQRETGVFRAIGARNRHILSIYGIYGLLMTIAAFVLALIVGQIICGVLTAAFADNIRNAALQYGGAEVPFSFNALNPTHLAVIFLGLVGGSTLGSFFPLLRALRRDPIKSLRDE